MRRFYCDVTDSLSEGYLQSDSNKTPWQVELDVYV